MLCFVGRMGNLTQALKLITERLQDVDHAIQFCMEQDDEELWENLIEYAMEKPSKGCIPMSLFMKWT